MTKRKRSRRTKRRGSQESHTSRNPQAAKGPFGELGRVAIGNHAADQFFMKFVYPAREFERPHFAPKLIGFRWREAGRNYRNLHRLLLEERHAEGLFENSLQGCCRIRKGLPAFAAAARLKQSGGAAT